MNVSVDDVPPISLGDFEDALTQVRASVSERDLDMYLQFDKQFGSANLVSLEVIELAAHGGGFARSINQLHHSVDGLDDSDVSLGRHIGNHVSGMNGNDGNMMVIEIDPLIFVLMNRRMEKLHSRKRLRNSIQSRFGRAVSVVSAGSVVRDGAHVGGDVCNNGASAGIFRGEGEVRKQRLGKDKGARGVSVEGGGENVACDGVVRVEEDAGVVDKEVHGACGEGARESSDGGVAGDVERVEHSARGGQRRVGGKARQTRQLREFAAARVGACRRDHGPSVGEETRHKALANAAVRAGDDCSQRRRRRWCHPGAVAGQTDLDPAASTPHGSIRPSTRRASSLSRIL
ncbi:hypothetical protein HDU84_001066 [Entophlyctis sp. JEL0112]|nr:hypothetical protein HDU84_001066 [Entophlyctis sp. JEL0112]